MNAALAVQPLTREQKRAYAIQCSIPMIAFGIMDNVIMITVGDLIDAHLGMHI